MTIIGDFAGIIAFVLFFRLIYLFFKSRKNKDMVYPAEDVKCIGIILK